MKETLYNRYRHYLVASTRLAWDLHATRIESLVTQIMRVALIIRKSGHVQMRRRPPSFCRMK